MLYHLLLLVSFAQAAPQTLEPITIIAKRSKLGVNPLTTQPTKISALTINERQYRQLNEVLGAIPSLAVVTSGGMGQQTSVYSRGLNGNHLQVKVDGMRINSPCEPSGSFDSANFTNAAVQQISITRGALSSFHGTGALGGVIDIRTKTGEDSAEKSVFFEAGSHNTARGQIDVQEKSNNLYFSLNGAGSKTGGYQQTLPQYRNATGEYKKLPYHLNQAAATIGGSNDHVSLTLYNRFYVAHKHYHDYQGMRLSQRQRQSLHRVEMITKGDWQHRLGLGALVDHQLSAPWDINYSQNNGKRFQLDWYQQIPISDFHKVALLIEDVRDQIAVKTPGYLIEKSQQQLAGALYYTALINDLTLETAFRAQHSNRYHIPITGGVGVAYQLLTTTKVFANLSTTFREPSLYELFGRNRYFEGNPLLTPEKGRGLEMGLKQQFLPTLTFVSTYFRYRIKQLIESQVSALGYFQYHNLNFAKSQGIDTTLNWQATSDLVLELGYCYIKAVDYLGQLLLRRPKHKLVTKATLRKEKWLLAADVVFVSRRSDISPIGWLRSTAKPYIVVNIKGSYSLNDSWQLFGRIDNFFNRKIEEPLGYRKVGISLYAGLKTQF